MKQLLASLAGGASPVTVTGLCRNANKTTAMCRLTAGSGEECLGLTSVGRDGECTDLVTGTEEPDLCLKKGGLFATARGMPALCDATLEVVDFTDVMTPLGPAAVLRILSNGYAQPARLPAVGQLPPLTRRSQELGAQWVFIGGAARRKSLVGTGMEGATLLCAGASLDWGMELVVAETAHTCWLSARKWPESAAFCAAPDDQEARFILPAPERGPVELPLEESDAPKWSELPRRPLVLWATGGIMDPLLKILVRRDTPTTLAAAGATHVLAGRTALNLLLRNSGELRVRRRLAIAAAGADPRSVYGWHSEPDKFVRALREVIDLPVVNTKED